jgi:hypothetical protein
MIISYTRNETEQYINIIDLFIKIQSISSINEEIIGEYNNNVDVSIFGHEFSMLNPDQQQRIINITNIDWSCLLERRLYINQYTKEHHYGFEAAAWYWHFVDVVWLFLFITVYWWGN